MWAELEVSQLNYADAIYQYKQVQEHDADYVFEILAPLSVCFQQCDQVSSFMLYLKGLIPLHPSYRFRFHKARQNYLQ